MPSNKKISLQLTCIMCHTEHTITVPQRGYHRWKCGEHIQDALPQLSDDDRELLVSHICGKCFDKIFGGDQ